MWSSNGYSQDVDAEHVSLKVSQNLGAEKSLLEPTVIFVLHISPHERVVAFRRLLKSVHVWRRGDDTDRLVILPGAYVHDT